MYYALVLLCIALQYVYVFIHVHVHIIINVVYINYFVAVYLEVESLSDQIVISFNSGWELKRNSGWELNRTPSTNRKGSKKYWGGGKKYWGGGLRSTYYINNKTCRWHKLRWPFRPLLGDIFFIYLINLLINSNNIKTAISPTSAIKSKWTEYQGFMSQSISRR